MQKQACDSLLHGALLCSGDRPAGRLALSWSGAHRTPGPEITCPFRDGQWAIRAPLAVQREKRNFDTSTNTSFLVVVFLWGGGGVRVLVACEFFWVNIVFHYTLKKDQAVVGRGEGGWALLSGQFPLEGERTPRGGWCCGCTMQTP